MWHFVFDRMKLSVAADLLWTQTFDVFDRKQFYLLRSDWTEGNWPGSCSSCFLTSHLLLLLFLLSLLLLLVYCFSSLLFFLVIRQVFVLSPSFIPVFFLLSSSFLWSRFFHPLFFLPPFLPFVSFWYLVLSALLFCYFLSFSLHSFISSSFSFVVFLLSVRSVFSFCYVSSHLLSSVLFVHLLCFYVFFSLSVVLLLCSLVLLFFFLLQRERERVSSINNSASLGRQQTRWPSGNINVQKHKQHESNWLMWKLLNIFSVKRTIYKI